MQKPLDRNILLEYYEDTTAVVQTLSAKSGWFSKQQIGGTMETKLFDSELKVMQVLWHEGDVSARQIAEVLNKEVGWNINTTYTLIKRCIKKGAILRSEPGFLCHALVRQEEVQQAETDELIDKIFDGSADKLFASLLSRNKISEEQLKRFKEWVEN